jgi:hypothetical protein
MSMFWVWVVTTCGRTSPHGITTHKNDIDITVGDLKSHSLLTFSLNKIPCPDFCLQNLSLFKKVFNLKVVLIGMYYL